MTQILIRRHRGCIWVYSLLELVLIFCKWCSIIIIIKTLIFWRHRHHGWTFENTSFHDTKSRRSTFLLFMLDIHMFVLAGLPCFDINSTHLQIFWLGDGISYWSLIILGLDISSGCYSLVIIDRQIWWVLSIYRRLLGHFLWEILLCFIVVETAVNNILRRIFQWNFVT